MAPKEGALIEEGDALFWKNSYDAALECYSKALALYRAASGENHPDIANTYIRMAWAYFLKKDYDRWLEVCEKAEETAPDEADSSFTQTETWQLTRIINMHSDDVELADSVVLLVQALMEGLLMRSDIAANCCWVLSRCHPADVSFCAPLRRARTRR